MSTRMRTPRPRQAISQQAWHSTDDKHVNFKPLRLPPLPVLAGADASDVDAFGITLNITDRVQRLGASLVDTRCDSLWGGYRARSTVAVTRCS
jgi:hypothetical protein